VKRILLVLTVALAAALSMLLMRFAPSAQAQANTETVNERTPVTAHVVNGCTGEEFDLKGTLHTVTHITEDAAGGLHSRGFVTFHGRGVSTSGAKYVVRTLERLHFNFGDDSASTATFTLTLRLIRQGSDTPEDDAQIRLLVHVTQNANGEVTAEVVKIRGECK
jgi:hypothetical protein